MTPQARFDFMAWRRHAAVASVLLALASLASLAANQVEWGLDFTGGSLVEVAFARPVDPEAVREQLAEAGYTGHVVQYFGSDRDLLVRVPPQKHLDVKQNAQLGDRIIQALRDTAGSLTDGEAPSGASSGAAAGAAPHGMDGEAPESKVPHGTDSEAAEGKALRGTGGGGVTLRRSEFVGPAVGEELTNQGGIGLLTALGIVLLYIAFRFQMKFAVGAVIALFHDVLITLGVFSLARWNFDLTVLAALLAVIGYSLNDTIVVSDRIRENFRTIRRTPPVDIINISLNQTLGRTLVTSFTTLLVLATLLLLGGELIRGFAIGLIIGVLIGTYSSIYVASATLLLLNITQEDLALPPKDPTDQGLHP